MQIQTGICHSSLHAGLGQEWPQCPGGWGDCQSSWETKASGPQAILESDLLPLTGIPLGLFTSGHLQDLGSASVLFTLGAFFLPTLSAPALVHCFSFCENACPLSPCVPLFWLSWAITFAGTFLEFTCRTVSALHSYPCPSGHANESPSCLFGVTRIISPYIITPVLHSGVISSHEITAFPHCSPNTIHSRGWGKKALPAGRGLILTCPSNKGF